MTCKMKTCTKCKVDKDESEFHKAARLRDGLQSQCKLCHKRNNKDHYDANTMAYKHNADESRAEVMELVRFIKEEGCCSRCGMTGWWRLAFHHTDPTQKDITIALVRSMPQLKLELPKCILVCHNCHADIHYEERTIG